MTEVNQTQQSNTEEDNNQVQVVKSGSPFSFIFTLALLIAVVWNWDGFWHTDIDWLTDGQQSLFPNKFIEEQLKVSQVLNNNKVIDRADERFNAIKEQNETLEDAKLAAEKRLKQLANLENEKCRYYDTALRMLDHLSKKYSEHELKRVLSCTSTECEQILQDRLLAQKVCSADAVSAYYQ